ncbi:polysaccharide lyase [Rhodococcus sp. NPDC056960]|uniref:polysaccharide lyase n=1 Tax=Rhodococcus sp. NPDC056960 TaxID=3345982 RepID=UPI00363368A9
MFHLHPALRSLAAAAAVVISATVTPLAVTPEAGAVPIIPAAARLFTGDYSSGDFSQWPSVQTKDYNGPGTGYVPSYSASIVPDPTYGRSARFEVRSGDVPSFGGGERSEVAAGNDTGGFEGQTRWYRFSTKFDPAFPQNHATLGWGLTNQWHQDVGVGSPPVAWSVGQRDGYWSLVVQKQSVPGAYLETLTLFETPLDVGRWHDVTMQINWSASDATGWIKLWLNGVPQTFTTGSDTYFVRTLIPGTSTVYYKEGYYREPMQPTGVVFHTGFRCATDEAAL